MKQFYPQRQFFNFKQSEKLSLTVLRPTLVLGVVKLLLLSVLLLIGKNVTATHVVGGGITYQHLEGSNYLLTVKLYRDCSPGTYGLPGSIDLQVREDDGAFPATSSYNLPLISNAPINPAVPACAFDPGICVEEAIYEDIVSLPETPGGLHMYFTICCRNATILNIVDPLDARETFYAYLPDIVVHGHNSSPIFNESPPVYVCAGEDLNLNFSATDLDGDSLDYYFYTPFDGENGTGITYGPGIPPDNINISPVNWQAGFGATDPLDPAPGLLPGLTIDEAGMISGIPTAPGQYVVGVMVDEYRDGELIGRISRDFQFNVLNCPPPLQAIIDTPYVCNGLTVDFTNLSTGLFTDSWWDFGTTDPADSSTVFEPTFTYDTPGEYTVTLIIDKGTDCADTTTLTFEILNEINMTVVTNPVSCNLGTDGSAFVTPDDGSLTYEWSTTETAYSVSELPAGGYWVEGTNALGCFDTVFLTIDEPNALATDFVLNQPLCFEGTDGSIEAMASGGTAPYTYEWTSPAISGSVLSGVGAGTYEVTVTDANGCTDVFTVTLDQPEELIIELVDIDHVTCFGGYDGYTEIDVIGGTAPYIVDWVSLSESGYSVNDLLAGAYPVEVTDANGCLTTMVVEINQPDTFDVNINILQEESCSSGNGILEAEVVGGTGDLTYEWEPDVSDSDLATGLSSGLYGLIVTDENGCEQGAGVYLPDNLTGTAGIEDVVPVSCEGGSDGGITVNMTGGTPDFSYYWSCGCPSAPSVAGLSAGDYWVAVVDALGCVDTLEFTIEELPALEIELMDVVSPNCYGEENGSATVGASGGTPAYDFEWSTTPPQYTETVSGIPAGTFTVTVTDQNGCEIEMDVPVSEPDPLEIHPEVLNNILCHGDSIGAITAHASGGTAPYQIYWNDFEVYADTLFDLGAGSYTVTASDDNGCSVDTTVKIIEYNSVIAEIVSDSIVCPGELLEFIVLTNDIHGLYEYLWYVDGVYVHEGSSYEHVIDEGTEISIALYSDYGCDPIFDTVYIEPLTIDPANLELNGTTDTICLGDAATLQAEVSDMTYIDSLYWSVSELSGFGPHTVYPVGTTNYQVTVVNICGEELTKDLLVNVHMPPATEIITSGLQACDSVQVNFSYDYEEGIYDLTESYWTIAGEVFESSEAALTFYSSTMINATAALTFSNGCEFEYSDDVGVTVFESPEADFYFNPDPAKQSELNEFVDISKGNPQVWEWYLEGMYISSEERPTWTFEEAGEFEVTEIVIDENGCSDTISHIVEVIGNFTVYVPNAFTPDGNGVNNEFKPVITNILDEGYEFMVFNRWGEVIFKTTDIYAAWNGTYGGRVVKDDVYIWKLIVRDEQSQRHEYNGHVTVLK